MWRLPAVRRWPGRGAAECGPERHWRRWPRGARPCGSRPAQDALWRVPGRAFHSINITYTQSKYHYTHARANVYVLYIFAYTCRPLRMKMQTRHTYIHTYIHTFTLRFLGRPRIVRSYRTTETLLPRQLCWYLVAEIGLTLLHIHTYIDTYIHSVSAM